MKFIFTTIFIAFYICISAQDIDKYPSQLIKDIEKIYKINPVNLSQIIVSDSAFFSNAQLYSANISTKDKVYVYVSKVHTCPVGGCSKPKLSLKNDGFEYFEYFIIFNDKGEIVSTRIYNYQATHGEQICSKGWLKQFKGYSGENNLVIGQDIDGISGATISCLAICEDIKTVTKSVGDYLNKQ